MHALPEHFVCDACGERQALDVLCLETASPVTLLCVLCCRCDTHRVDDPGGRAVFSGAPLTWRGLHDSEHRTRRHA